MRAVSAESQRALFLRLGAMMLLTELAHGMLLYGIIPDIAQVRFRETVNLFGVLPVRAVEVQGYCLAAYTLAELFFKLPAGHWVDSKGPTAPLRAGLIVSVLTIPVILWARQPEMMLLGAFLHGVGAAPVWPAVIAAWTRGRSPQERGHVMGQILTAWMAGMGAGLILGNILVDLSGRAELIYTISPIMLLSVPVVLSFLGNRLPGPGHDDVDAGGMLESVPPEIRVMALGLFLQNLAFGSLILVFREFSLEKLQLLPSQFGLLVLFGGAPAVGLLTPAGKIADRIGRRNAVIYPMMIVSPLIIGAPFLHYLHLNSWLTFVLMIPGLVVAALAYALMLPAWHALAIGRIPEHQRGRCLALLMSIEMVALAGGHVVGPTLYAKMSFLAPFIFGGVSFMVLAVIYKLGYILPHDLPVEVRDVPLTPDEGSPPPAPPAGGTA